MQAQQAEGPVQGMWREWDEHDGRLCFLRHCMIGDLSDDDDDQWQCVRSADEPLNDERSDASVVG